MSALGSTRLKSVLQLLAELGWNRCVGGALADSPGRVEGTMAGFASPAPAGRMAGFEPANPRYLATVSRLIPNVRAIRRSNTQ